MTSLSFSTVLKYILYQLKQHLMEKDGQHRTLLHLAALSGNKDTVDAVWDACKERGIEATEVPMAS